LLFYLIWVVQSSKAYWLWPWIW